MLVLFMHISGPNMCLIKRKKITIDWWDNLIFHSHYRAVIHYCMITMLSLSNKLRTAKDIRWMQGSFSTVKIGRSVAVVIPRMLQKMKMRSYLPRHQTKIHWQLYTRIVRLCHSSSTLVMKSTKPLKMASLTILLWHIMSKAIVECT